METFSSRVSSWWVRGIAYLTLEVVEVGGGTSKMFADLAEFARNQRSLEKAKKNMLRYQGKNTQNIG